MGIRCCPNFGFYGRRGHCNPFSFPVKAVSHSASRDVGAGFSAGFLRSPFVRLFCSHGHGKQCNAYWLAGRGPGGGLVYCFAGTAIVANWRAVKASERTVTPLITLPP